MSQSVAADVELPPTPARCLSSGGPRMREWRLLRPTLLCPRGLRWRSPHEARGDGAPNTSKKCDVKHWFGGDLASALSKELTICVEVWEGAEARSWPRVGLTGLLTGVGRGRSTSEAEGGPRGPAACPRGSGDGSRPRETAPGLPWTQRPGPGVEMRAQFRAWMAPLPSPPSLLVLHAVCSESGEAESSGFKPLELADAYQSTGKRGEEVLNSPA